jgi:large-conductance mechanosensitive channel
MGRNDIRLRRNRISAGNIARHRNYSELLSRHKREQKLKRQFKLFIYFLIIAFLILLFVIVVRWEQREEREQRRNQYPTPTAFLNQGPS